MEAKVGREHRAKYQKGESNTQGLLEIFRGFPFESSAEYCLVHVCDETTYWGKNHLKWLRATSESHIRPGIVPVPTSQS